MAMIERKTIFTLILLMVCFFTGVEAKTGQPAVQPKLPVSTPQKTAYTAEEYLDNTILGQAPDIPPALLQDANEKVLWRKQLNAPAGFVSSEDQVYTSPFKKNPKKPHHVGDFTPSSEEQKKDIYLDFENSDLKAFVSYIEQIRDINITTDKSIENQKISLSMRSPVTKDGAWNIFLTVLEMSGFSIVKLGEVYSVMPRDKKNLQPLPTFIGVNPDQLPDNNLTIRYVAFLDNIPVAEVTPLLSSMLSPGASIVQQPEVNGMVITDKAYSIKCAMKVILELDQTGLQETVLVMRLKNANAQDVKTLFDSLTTKERTNAPAYARMLGKQGESPSEYFSSTTKMIVDPRTNSLILLGNRKSLEKVQAFITENIDTNLKETATPLRIYELQHSNAEDMVSILREVTSNSSLSSQVGQRAAQFGAVKGNVKYFKNMQIQADKIGNRIIVSTTDDNDWELLKEVIRDLDKAQPQVHVDFLFATISSSKLQQLGGQIRNKKDFFGGNVNFQSQSMGTPVLDNSSGAVSILANLLQGVAGLTQGSTIFSLGTGTDIWSVFKMLKQETDATVMTTPFLLATNRTQASLSFGEKRRIVTQNAIGSTGAVGSAPAFGEASALSTITILPQINMDGVIKMQIKVDITEFLDTEGTQTQSKVLETNATIGNGQVLVMGGFVKTKGSGTKGETPFLSKIPILGWLAKSEQRTLDKDYVFLFVCPTILKPRSTPGVNPYTRIKLHQATEEVGVTLSTADSNDPFEKWFFNPEKEEYSHKVTDFANARYQPTTVDLKNDPYYRTDSYNEKTLGLRKDAKFGTPSGLIAHTKSLKMHDQQKALIESIEEELAREASSESGKTPFSRKELLKLDEQIRSREDSREPRKREQKRESAEESTPDLSQQLLERLLTERAISTELGEKVRSDAVQEIPSVPVLREETAPVAQEIANVREKNPLRVQNPSRETEHNYTTPAAQPKKAAPESEPESLSQLDKEIAMKRARLKQIMADIDSLQETPKERGIVQKEAPLERESSNRSSLKSFLGNDQSEDEGRSNTNRDTEQTSSTRRDLKQFLGADDEQVTMVAKKSEKSRFTDETTSLSEVDRAKRESMKKFFDGSRG